VATEWQRFTVEIPSGFSSADREVIADEIIDFMRERTKQGLSWKNQPLAGYSESYAKSLNFKIAGKSKGKVDLTQSGDTLGALTLLDSKDGKLVIGFEKGSQENAIADGNIRGTYGQARPVGPKRDFLGITQADLSRILENFTPDETEISRAAREGVRRLSSAQEDDSDD
jgi:hypothetical protein